MGRNKKRREIFHYSNLKKFDVIFLQETHGTSKCETRWMAESGKKIYFSHGTSTPRGVAIMINKKANIKVEKQITDKQGYYLILVIKYKGQHYQLVNIYASNEDDRQFFVDCSQVIEEQGIDLRIIAGDFNLVLDVEVDKSGGGGGLPHTHEESTNFLRTYVMKI